MIAVLLTRRAASIAGPTSGRRDTAVAASPYASAIFVKSGLSSGVAA
jgi:hypothetical protein